MTVADRRRRPSLVIAAVLALLVALGQLVALVPPSWWGPALDRAWPQYAIIVIGLGRDELGIWVVLIALVATLLAWRALAGRATTFRRSVAALASLGLLGSVVSSAALVYTAVDQGAGFRPFAPLLPGTAAFGHPDETVTTGTVDGQELRADLYLPEAKGPAPVVVYVHGGGFDGGSRGPNAVNRHLADHGYAVLDIDYRLARPGDPTWEVAVDDVGCALGWVGREGATAGLDADRVALMGESAGGNLAINAAYLSASGDLTPSCGSTEDLPEVRAVIGGYPAVDLSSSDGQSAFGRRIGEVYIGGSPDEFPERYAYADSVTHATPDAPPTLVYQGSRDHLVLPGPVEDFVREVREIGVPTRYTRVPATEHGVGDLFGTPTRGTHIVRAVTLQWLDAHVR